MKISIIIPTYKTGFYFQECLKSINTQTFNILEIEVVIVLNGNKDPYFDYVSQTIKQELKDVEVQFIYTEQLGVSNARNIAIDVAKGEYICFVDDDDILSPNYLEELYKVSSPICVGCANSLSFYDGNSFNTYQNFLTRHYHNCEGKIFTQFVYRGFLSPPCCKLIHRDVLSNIRYSTEAVLGEDSLFCFGLAPSIKDMKLADSSAVYYYRQRPHSSVHIDRPIRFYLNNWRALISGYLKYYFQHPLEYDVLFLLSRMGGATSQCFGYIIKKICRDLKN